MYPSNLPLPHFYKSICKLLQFLGRFSIDLECLLASVLHNNFELACISKDSIAKEDDEESMKKSILWDRIFSSEATNGRNVKLQKHDFLICYLRQRSDSFFLWRFVWFMSIYSMNKNQAVSMYLVGMAVCRIFGSDSNSYKNPFKKMIFHGLRILGILADFLIRIADWGL